MCHSKESPELDEAVQLSVAKKPRAWHAGLVLLLAIWSTADLHANDAELEPIWDLALAYRRGDAAMAREGLLDLAASGNTEAMWLIGESMLALSGRKPRLFDFDFDTGMAWVVRAAEAGNTYAADRLFEFHSYDYFNVHRVLPPFSVPPREEVENRELSYAWTRLGAEAGSYRAVLGKGLYLLVSEKYAGRPRDERTYAYALGIRRYVERLLDPGHRNVLFARIIDPRVEMRDFLASPVPFYESQILARKAFFEAIRSFPDPAPIGEDGQPLQCNFNLGSTHRFNSFEQADQERLVACYRANAIAWLERFAQDYLSPERWAEVESAIPQARRDEIDLWVESWLDGFEVAQP